MSRGGLPRLGGATEAAARLTPRLAEGKAESLAERIARAKARWLRRVLYGSAASSTEKCLAYAVSDHLNCVTLDCWPSQARLAELLGFDCERTVQRAARGLAGLGFLVIRRGARGVCRYAPVFLPGEDDIPDPKSGRKAPSPPDTAVRESFLLTHLNQSCSMGRPTVGSRELIDSGYQPNQRGSFELEISRLLGDNGFEILSSLDAIDEHIVERLCRAHATGSLTHRELSAARLAAEQRR